MSKIEVVYELFQICPESVADGAENMDDNICVAGFIGSNLLEHLLRLEQHIMGLDNSAVKCSNLNESKNSVTEKQWQSFNLSKGDMRIA
jgi:16S rRNA G1207 methylase RsmC